MKVFFRPIVLVLIMVVFFAINITKVNAQCCIEVDGFTVTPDPGMSGSLVNFIIRATTVDSSEKASFKAWTFDTVSKFITVYYCFKAKSYPIQTTHIDTVSIPANLLKTIGTYTVFARVNLSHNNCLTVGSTDTIYRRYKVFPVGLDEPVLLNGPRMSYDRETNLMFFHGISPGASVRIMSIEGFEVMVFKEFHGESVSLNGISDGCYIVEVIALGRKTHRRFLKL